MMKHHNNIQKWRIYRDLSQQQLADAIGCSIAGLRLWEKGNSIPKLQTINKLLQALEVDFEQLFEQELGGGKKC